MLYCTTTATATAVHEMKSAHHQVAALANALVRKIDRGRVILLCDSATCSSSSILMMLLFTHIHYF